MSVPVAGSASPLVVDTHAAVWFLEQDPRLSLSAKMRIRGALASGHAIHVPSICLIELVYLVDKKRIPAAVANRLGQVLADSEFGFRLAALDRQVAGSTRQIPRDNVPDLPDRVIAAIALAPALPLVTRDGKIHSSQI